MPVVDFQKDPNDRLDYSFDWSEWLAQGETITNSVMETSVGLTIDTASNSISAATAWLIGGTSGHVYTLTNRITTSAGRIKEKSMRIRVTDQ